MLYYELWKTNGLQLIYNGKLFHNGKLFYIGVCFVIGEQTNSTTIMSYACDKLCYTRVGFV